MQVHAVGGGTQRGAQLAQQYGDELDRSYQRWAGAQSERGVDGDELAEKLGSVAAWTTVERLLPDLTDELKSLSVASGVAWHKIAALSMLDEAWALTGGMACTAIAVTRPGKRAAGQNMDLELWTDTLQTVMSVRDANGLGVITATYPGTLGTCGMNDRGVVVIVNALDLATDLSGVPVSFVMRAALHQPTAAQAIELIRELPHAAGQTYTVVDAHDIFMVEGDANGVMDVQFDPYVALHTNHSFTREHPVSASSRTRYDAVVAQHDSLNNAHDIMDMLTNTDSGVCQVAGRFTPGMFTFMGIVGDCLERRVWVNVSPASGGRFTEYSFG